MFINMKISKVNFDSLREATKEFVKFRDDLDWSKFHGPSMLATSLSVEVGELLEHFLWKTVDR